MREPLVCLKTEFFFTFSHLCGQVVLSNEGNCKICAAWHISCCPYQMSQKKSSLASADTANFLRLHLWLQELVLRGGCWRFWTELIWGSSNTEDSEGSRLPWGTNQYWSQVYVIYARALEDETCSCCYLHQGRVTAGREKRQIPPLVSCGMKEIWFCNILLCLCYICPLPFLCQICSCPEPCPLLPFTRTRVQI